MTETTRDQAPTRDEDRTPVRAVDFEGVRQVSSAIVLDRIVTVGLTASVRRPLEHNVPSELRRTIGVRAARMLDGPDDMIASLVETTFRVLDEDQEALAIDSQHFVFYAVPPGTTVAAFSEEHLNQFAEINGIFHAWPYIRELIGSTSARLGLVGVVLPVWRTPKTLPPPGEYATFDWKPEPQVAGS